MPVYTSSDNARFYKLKNDVGKFVNIRVNTLSALAGDIITMDPTAVPIPNTNNSYYIDHFGNVYSFLVNKSGSIMTPSIGSSGYPKISLVINGAKVSREIHNLMCSIFILEDYTKQGLVCLHKDNNKLNTALSNLRVGTYSENNKQAYSDGLNPGNGLKKNIDEALV